MIMSPLQVHLGPHSVGVIGPQTSLPHLIRRACRDYLRNSLRPVFRGSTRGLFPCITVLWQAASVRAPDGTSGFVMGRKLSCRRSMVGSVPYRVYTLRYIGLDAA